MPRVDGHDERRANLDGGLDLAELAAERVVGAGRDRDLLLVALDLVHARAARQRQAPLHARELLEIRLRRLLDPADIREVAFGVKPLDADLVDALRVLDAAVCLRAAERAEAREAVDERKRIELLADLVALGVDDAPDAVVAHRARLVLDQLLDRVGHLARSGSQETHLVLHILEASDRCAQPCLVEVRAWLRNRRQGLLRELRERLRQRLHDRAVLLDAAFGRVDGAQPAALVLQEERLEALEVRLHLPVGEDRAAVDVLELHEVGALANDARPLEVLDRVERVELGRPDLVDRRAAGVVDAVGEAEVLADERDGIAAEEARDLVAEVRDGRAWRKPSGIARDRPEHGVEVRRGDDADAAREALRDNGVRLRVEDQRGVADIVLGEPFVEALRDVVPVERRDEVRADAFLEERLQHRLGGDDQAAVAHAGLGEEMQVLAEARACADDDAEAALRDALQRQERLATDIVARVAEDRADRVRAARKQRRHRVSRAAHDLGHDARTFLRVLAEPAAARRVLEELDALHERALEADQAVGVVAGLLGAVEQDKRRQRKLAREVDFAQDRLQEREIALEHDHDAVATHAVADLGHVIAKAEAHHDHGALGRVVDAVGKGHGLGARRVARGERTALVARDPRAVCSAGPLERRGGRLAYRADNVGISRTQRGEIALEHGVSSGDRRRGARRSGRSVVSRCGRDEIGRRS